MAYAHLVLVMKIYDISKELLSAPVYPGDPTPQVNKTHSEDGFTTSSASFCLHAATHVDAPSHVKEGSPCVNDIPLESFFGPCIVMTAEGKIGLGNVSKIKRSGAKRVLLRGGEITPTAAFELSFLKLSLIGVEGITVGGRNTHKNLLSAGTVILEGLDLSGVPDGEYILSALPLKIDGTDGSPVRAVLIAQND